MLTNWTSVVTVIDDNEVVYLRKILNDSVLTTICVLNVQRAKCSQGENWLPAQSFHLIFPGFIEWFRILQSDLKTW